jgi:hypothetical protein
MVFYCRSTELGSRLLYFNSSMFCRQVKVLFQLYSLMLSMDPLETNAVVSFVHHYCIMT